LAKWAGVLIALFLLGTALLYAGLRSYLHSDAFREFLSNRVSRATGVEGTFSPFHWEGLALRTEVFSAKGDGAIRELRIDGLQTEVGLDGVRRGVWELKNSSIGRLQVSFDARKGQNSGFPETTATLAPKAKRKSGWLPRELELRGLELGKLSLNALTDQGPVVAEGIQVTVENEKSHRAYRVELSDGTLRGPFEFLPEVRLDQARLRIQPEAVFLTHLTANAFSAAVLDATGEWNRETRGFNAEGRVSNVKCDELLNEDWSRRLTGEIASDFTVNGGSGTTTASGLLTITNGMLTALPVLDALAAYSDTRRFRTLTLSEARTEWRWQNGVYELNDIVLASDSLIRLEGRVIIRGNALDGHLRLGLAPGTLANIPGAETHVFAPGERGLMWASLRLTGSLDDPQEDLSDRLITAAGIRMLETLPESGAKVLRYSRSLLGDDPAGAVEKGVRIIEEGEKTVREVGGILDGILGGSRREIVPPPPQKEQDQ
jgi:hypothetical protein